jgi:hypothetical protein
MQTWSLEILGVKGYLGISKEFAIDAFDSNYVQNGKKHSFLS